VKEKKKMKRERNGKRFQRREEEEEKKKTNTQNDQGKTVGRAVWNVIDVIIIIIDFLAFFFCVCFVSLSTDKNRNREGGMFSSSFELATQD
jgi:hypothetical protein